MGQLVKLMEAADNGSLSFKLESFYQSNSSILLSTVISVEIASLDGSDNESLVGVAEVLECA